MTSWTPEPLSPRGPVYLAIADALAADVQGGRLQPGERLPTHRELARRLDVNVVTVTRAYAEAARRGLVEGAVGRGTFVSGVEPRSAVGPALQPEPEGRIDFQFNLPAPGAGEPPVELVELYGELSADGIDPLHTRYVVVGREEHRAAGCEWIARSGITAAPDEIVVTSGAQHALTVALTTLAEPGDTVLCEELTYPGIKALASLLHLRTAPVALDGDGLVPDALELACRKTNPKLLYCMPTLQNPTGVVWTEERRGEVARIARRYGVVLVEDDTTGFLAEQPAPPLATLAPELTLFVASLSKSVGAGLRTGYLVLPRPERRAPSALRSLAERAVSSLAAVSWMAAPLMAEISARLIRSGAADRIVAGKRREARERRRLFERILGAPPTPSHPASPFVWLSLPEPWRSSDLVAAARQAGVGVTSPEAFVVGRGQAPHAVRVCIATPPERAEVERGLTLLAGILARRPDVRQPLV